MVKGLFIMPTHTDYRDRFIDQVESLIKRGIVGKQAEIAEAIGYDPTSLTNVLKKRRPLPQSVYKRFTEVYKLEPMIVATDENEDYRAKYVASLEVQVRDKDERIKLLLGYIDSLRDEMRELALINQTIAVVSQDLLVEAVALLGKRDRRKVAETTGRANYETLKKAKASGKLIEWDK
jgi:hypothetical protein